MSRMTNAQETLHEISFAMGHAWARLPGSAACRLSDMVVNGSRGIAALAVEWSEEFEELYRFDQGQDQAYLNGIEVDGYIDAVEDFFQLKWNALVAGAVKKRLLA